MTVDDYIVGCLIVATIIAGLILAIVAESLRGRVGAVGPYCKVIERQIETVRLEIAAFTAAHKRLAALIDEGHIKLRERRNVLANLQHQLDEANKRRPVPVYITDQTIQATYRAWMVVLQRAGQLSAAGDGSPWERHILVFGENAAGVARRLEVRYPPSQGYRLGVPVPFDLEGGGPAT